MISSISTNDQLSPGLAFWLQWVLASCVTGLAIAVVAYFDVNLAFNVGAFAGLVLGSLQGVALWKYLGKYAVLRWTFFTAAGWFSALIVVFLGDFIYAVGCGLNGRGDCDPRLPEIAVCVIAGVLFSAMQRLLVPALNPVLWLAINGLAWGLATFIGGSIALAVNNSLDHYSAYAPFSMGNSAIAAMIVYGVVSGLGAIWLLRRGENYAR